LNETFEAIANRGSLPSRRRNRDVVVLQMQVLENDYEKDFAAALCISALCDASGT